MHIFCNAAFRSVALYQFLLRIATGPEFVTLQGKWFGELITFIVFCNALPFTTKTLPTRKNIFELFSDYRFTISISSN